MPDLCLDLTHVSKTYKGKVHALRGIDMRVARASVFGLLGPNGAGKSTLVKILMTVIRPTRAEGTMLGGKIGDKSLLARVGYLPEHNRFPEYLTGAQVLDFFGALSFVPRAERKKRAGELLALVGMSKWAEKRVRTYSKGMRQRMGIAQALMNDPDLVVLDEPTDGVDPVGRRDIRNVLLHLKERGKTVFLNSHILSELEMVCDRVAILVQGKVTSQGTIDELTVHRQRHEIEIAGDDPAALASTMRAALPAGASVSESTGADPSVAQEPPPIRRASPPTGLRAVPTAAVAVEARAKRDVVTGVLASGEKIEIEKNMLRIATADPAVVQPVLDGLRRQGAVIRSLRAIRPSLEDLFMEAVTDPTTGQAYEPGAQTNRRARRGKGDEG
jgi:ABC-2 type transport system ATP-binding protein